MSFVKIADVVNLVTKLEKENIWVNGKGIKGSHRQCLAKEFSGVARAEFAVLLGYVDL